jgi:hypothetical protein
MVDDTMDDKELSGELQRVAERVEAYRQLSQRARAVLSQTGSTRFAGSPSSPGRFGIDYLTSPHIALPPDPETGQDRFGRIVIARVLRRDYMPHYPPHAPYGPYKVTPYLHGVWVEFSRPVDNSDEPKRFYTSAMGLPAIETCNYDLLAADDGLFASQIGGDMADLDTSLEVVEAALAEQFPDAS